MRKIKKWDDFSDFIGKEMYDLWEMMPDCFERIVIESGRQVFTHIYSGQKLEIIHDGWGIITKISKID